MRPFVSDLFQKLFGIGAMRAAVAHVHNQFVSD
jgi:hypothetical protein